MKKFHAALVATTMLISSIPASGIVITYAYNPEGGCISRKEQIKILKSAYTSDSINAPVYITPTLVTDVVSIKLDSTANIDENFTFNLSDLSGNSILGGKITEQITAIDISSFPPAYYIITVMSSTNAKSFKIIKL